MKGCVYLTITVPKEFKAIMDREARSRFMTRSEFVRWAVTKICFEVDSYKARGGTYAGSTSEKNSCSKTN